MLFSSFSSPRRLALLAAFVFLGALFFLRNGEYRERLPEHDFPGLQHGSQPSEDGGEPAKAEERPPTAYPPVAPDVQLPPTPEHAWILTIQPDAATATSTSLATHSPSAGLAAIANTSLPAVSTPPPLANMTHAEQQAAIKALIQWERPTTDHWPSWGDYADTDYDPNRWEGFEWENDFYIDNGVEKLKEENSSAPAPYTPYPEYNSPAWERQWWGLYTACEGPRGKPLGKDNDGILMAYNRIPTDFPPHLVGSADALGLDETHCFDRVHRYGPYGFGQSDRADVSDGEPPNERPDWSAVQWGNLQDKCLIANRNRYAPGARGAMNLVTGTDLPEPMTLEDLSENGADKEKVNYHSRTALLIRTWVGYTYTENDLQVLRALISELSLLSGGEYQVYLFVNVKDGNADILKNQTVYDEILRQAVPREFSDISVLWNERICEEWYPDVGDWQVYWSQFMPLQWFSQKHPEFDYIWNWETDARYTGNHYHFLEQIAAFAKRVPRKYLWERNQRFYFPGAHGSYEQWLNDTHAIIDSGIRAGTVQPVWGPLPYNSERQKPIGPKPPRAMEQDQFEWGVNEEADLITLQPIWEPTKTAWTYRNEIWNFVPGVHPHFSADDPLDRDFDHPDFANIPRRVYINTLSRFSSRLLAAMHRENRAGRNMQAEMWPATVALHHGLKAVYAPHPIWADRKWPPWYLDAVFNADGGAAAQWGQRNDSVYNHDREANFRGWSSYYATGFPRTLYRRWLGWRAADGPLGDIGGEQWERAGVILDLEPEDARPRIVGGNGRMCLPGMLLHPVKNVVEVENRSASP